MPPDAAGHLGMAFSSRDVESRKRPGALVMLPKLKVAGSIPVARSSESNRRCYVRQSALVKLLGARNARHDLRALSIGRLRRSAALRGLALRSPEGNCRVPFRGHSI